jgi:hypothetical protein
MWFERLLAELRVLLRRYPGVARRLSLYGPTVPAAATTVDRGIRLLQEAGFGGESVLVYNLLLSSACRLISGEDDRMHQLGSRTDNAELLGSFAEHADLPGMAAMGEFVHGLLAEPERMALFHADFYDYAIQRCLDGVSHRLGELGRQAG